MAIKRPIRAVDLEAATYALERLEQRFTALTQGPEPSGVEIRACDTETRAAIPPFDQPRDPDLPPPRTVFAISVVPSGRFFAPDRRIDTCGRDVLIDAPAAPGCADEESEDGATPVAAPAAEVEIAGFDEVFPEGLVDED